MTNYGSRLRVLVAGAGVAGLETALALQALASEFVSVELVAPETEFTYRPLAVTEPFRLGEVRRFPLAPLVRAAGAQLRRGMLTAVDPEQKLVTLDQEDVLGYDVLVLTAQLPRAGSAPLRGAADADNKRAQLERLRDFDLPRRTSPRSAPACTRCGCDQCPCRSAVARSSSTTKRRRTQPPLSQGSPVIESAAQGPPSS